MSGHGFRVRGAHDHEVEHQAQHGPVLGAVGMGLDGMET